MAARCGVEPATFCTKGIDHHHSTNHASNIQNKRLCYVRHLTWMQDERYPKTAYNGYVHGVRERGRPKKLWIDMIREDCKELNMTLQEATHVTQDRRVWRATIDERLTHVTASPGPGRRSGSV